jgi:dTDP-4-dehydrorhamnose reductase
MRVLVLGSNGMAGHVIKEHLSTYSKFDLLGIEEEFFLSFTNNHLKKILEKNPDIIINTLRLTVEESEQNPKLAIIINSIIPKKLELFFYNSNVRIIHLSTDCVFSGDKGGYIDMDIPDGSSVYSLTKLNGEILNNKDFTIRTSYIGPSMKGKSEELFDWFMKQNGNVNGFNNSIWNGITTLELSKMIYIAIANEYSGLYHLGSKQKISKYHLLNLIKIQWNKKNILISKVEGQKIDRSLVDTKGYFNIVNYEKMFEELYIYMKKRNLTYSHYYESI